MKEKPRYRKSLIALLVLLLFCAAYLAHDVAGGETPAISFLLPTGAICLFCIYFVLKKMGVPFRLCCAIPACLFATSIIGIRLAAKESPATESWWVPVTHLDFMCKDAGHGNIQLCSITCKESCREVYAGVFKMPDGKVMVYFCREKPDAPAERLTSCELNSGRSVFRVVVRPDRELASLCSVNVGDGSRARFTNSPDQQLTPVFVHPAISPQQALQIASRELQMSPDSLAVYAGEFCYSVEPRMPEDSLGGGESVDIDMNTGSILKRYFTE